jgi:hypothetical protein
MGGHRLAANCTARRSVARLDQFKLYSSFHFWMDARFYMGWSLGLLLAPSPNLAAADERSDRTWRAQGTLAIRRTPPRLPLS